MEKNKQQYDMTTDKLFLIFGVSSNKADNRHTRQPIRSLYLPIGISDGE